MLRDCIEIFKKIYDEKGERLILDSYELSAGTYRTILVEDDAFRVIETVEIGRTKKDENQGDGMDPGLYYELKFYDYHSKLLGTNKAVDTKKAIHSNNYMAFFVKKNSIAERKIDVGAIDRYYDTLKDPFIKYKKGKTADIYREFEGTNGAPDGELIEKIRLFVKSGKCWDDIDCSRKDYLKIFFLLPDKDETETLYRKEGARYLVPNLYLNNDYNISMQDRTLGLPGNNMGMNSKKPYLLHKTRMVETPYLLERETAMMQNLFFDYLLGNVSKGKANIYLGDGGGKPMMISVSDWETPGAVSDGYYLRLQKGKNGAEIIKADVVTHYSSSMEEPFILKAYVPIGPKSEESRLPYGEKIRELEKLKDLIDRIFFNGFLRSNFFTNPRDIPAGEAAVKRCMLESRDTLHSWFYMGNPRNADRVLEKVSWELIKSSLSKEDGIYEARRRGNLRWSLMDYFSGDERMWKSMGDVRTRLREHINSGEEWVFDDGNELSYAIGQAVRYLLSKSRAAKLRSDVINPFIRSRNFASIKRRLLQLYERYNYDIYAVKGNRAHSMMSHILRAGEDLEMSREMIAAGFMDDPIIYEPKEDRKGAEDDE